MTVAERRQALLEWFYADEERSGMGTVGIAAQATCRPQAGRSKLLSSWIYPTTRCARDRAYRDLKALAADGQIWRGSHGGKATWWYA